MVKKIIVSLIAITLLLFTGEVNAVKTAGNSASLSAELSTSLKAPVLLDMHIKRLSIKSVFEKHNSPLKTEVSSFISACQLYALDCYLLPAISGLESSYGKKMIEGSHNPFGWGGGKIMFDSYDEALLKIGKGIRNIYYDNGKQTIEDIGLVYAESKTWSSRVSSIYLQFEKEEENIRKSNIDKAFSF